MYCGGSDDPLHEGTLRVKAATTLATAAMLDRFDKDVALVGVVLLLEDAQRWFRAVAA